jgi:hypothetical protein
MSPARSYYDCCCSPGSLAATVWLGGLVVAANEDGSEVVERVPELGGQVTWVSKEH